MFDTVSHQPGERRSPRLHQPLPRELAVAASILVVIMIAMGVALWAVAGTPTDPHGHADGNSGAPAPRDQLLQTLAAELSPGAGPDDLEAAVSAWLDDQQPTSRTLMLASAGPVG